MTATALERATAAYIERYGSEPTLITRAPGRVNIIGEHTDYNGGFVMPLAIRKQTIVVGRGTLVPEGQARDHGELVLMRLGAFIAVCT